MDEYAAAVRQFYQTLRPIRKEYDLRVSIRQATDGANYVKIYWAMEMAPQRLVIKIEEQDETLCFRKARQELITWYQNRKQMEKQREAG